MAKSTIRYQNALNPNNDYMWGRLNFNVNAQNSHFTRLTVSPSHGCIHEVGG